MTPFFRMLALLILPIPLLFPSTLMAQISGRAGVPVPPASTAKDGVDEKEEKKGKPTLADGDDAEVEKATTAFLEYTKSFFEHAKELQGKSEKEQIEYIVKTATKAIQDKITKSKWDLVKKGVTAFADAKYRAYLFQQAALPKIRAQILEKGTLDPRIWRSIDEEIKSNHQNVMGQLAVGIEIWEVSYEFANTWNNEGPNKAGIMLAKKFAEKLGEAMIPGWGVYRAAQGAVEALGNFVLEYAFDTALKGIMKDLLPHSPDSPEFSKWLLGMNDISAFVQREWDEQYAHSGKFYLKYTDWDEEKKEFRDKDGEGMKKRIIAELENARDKLKKKEAEEEKIRSDIVLAFQEVEEPAKYAAARVGILNEQIVKEVQSSLEKYEELRVKLQGARKQEAVAVVGKVKARAEKEERDLRAGLTTGPSCSGYKRLSDSNIVETLQRSLDEIRESGVDGYDATKMRAAYTEYQQLRNEALAASAAAIAACSKIFSDPMKDLRNKVAQAAQDENERNTLESAYARLQWKMNEELRVLGTYQGNDIAILEKEEQKALAEAMERSTKMLVAMTGGIDKLRSMMAQATRGYLDGATEVEEEIKSKLKYPEAWRSDYYTIRIGTGEPSPVMAGDLLKEVERLQEARKQITQDQEQGRLLHRKEMALAEGILGAARDVRNEFERLAPKNLQVITEAGAAWTDCDVSLGVQRFMSVMGELIPSMLDASDKTPPLCLHRMHAGIPNATRIAELKRPPLKSEETIANIDKRLAYLAPFVVADEAAISYGRLDARVSEVPYMYMNLEYDLEKEKDRAADMFRKKGNLRPTYMAPEESDGIGHLKEMKIAWEFSKGMVARMNTLRKPIVQLASYARDFQGTFAALDKWNTIPSKITIYENALQAARKEYETKIAGAANSAKAARDQLEALKKRDDYYNIDVIEKAADQLASQSAGSVRWYGSFPKEWPMDARLSPIVEEWKRLNAEVPAFKKELAGRRNELETRRKTQEEEQRRLLAEEEARRKQEEAQKRQEEARRQQEQSQQTMAMATARVQAVRELYDRFRQAYESKNDSQVMGFIGDDWQSGDGTTLSDLQVNLNRTFRTFDEIKYNLQNVQIQIRSEGVYQVSYDVTITSRIFKRNLRHEEKSSVMEEVRVDPSGKAKISKTFNGRFWYVK